MKFSGFVYIAISGLLLLIAASPASSIKGDPNEKFFTLIDQVKEFAREEQLDSAAHYLEQCSSLLKKFETHTDYYDSAHISMADAYFSVGQHYRSAREFQTAKKYQKQALNLRVKFLPDNDPRIGESYYFLALTKFILGDYDSGMVYINKSITHREAAFGKKHERIADSYNLRGSFYSVMDHYDEAVINYSKSLAMRISLLGEEHPDVASSYNNLGIVARQRGDYDAALEYYHQALAIRLATQGEEHRLTADNYMNIGVIYSSKEMEEEAIKYYKKALDIRRSVYGEKDISIALVLNNIGVTYRSAGDYDSALAYLTESLEMRREILGNVHPDIAQSLNNIGVVYKKTGHYDKALAFLGDAIEQRLQIFGEHSTQTADSYIYVGNTYRSMQDYDNALINYRKAIASLVPGFDSMDVHDHSIYDRSIINRSLLNALAEKAQLYHNMYADTPGNLEPLYAAIPLYHTARHVTDLLRNTYTAEQSKLLLSDFSADIFDEAVNTLFLLYEASGEPQYVQDAFTFAEHSRALLLWESIIDSRARSFAGIPDEKLDKEQEIHRQLIQTRMRYQRTRSDSDNYQTIRENYFDSLMKYRSFITELEQEYPRYFALKHDISSPSISQTQNVLDENTALLQFHLGGKNSFLFVMNDKEYSIIKLAPSEQIEDFTNRLRRSIRLVNPQDFINVSTELYTQLIEPALPLIESRDKLVIIPDGALHHLPFETLISEAVYDDYRNISFSSLQYLIQEYSITYNYSSKLAVYKLEQERDTITRTPQPRFAGFAPVFTTDRDENARPVNLAYARDSAEQPTREFSLAWFPDLPHSEEEVHAIVNLFGMEDHRTAGFYHSDATKENFLASAEEYTHIHIASHGFFNEEEPMLSGVLFSPGDYSDIEGERDILFAGEIYGLNLDSDLVVLSSCESGVGTLQRGEGIMSLTRGFIHAGARNLLVSLWKVTDRHTADLMEEFYRHVLQGETYTEALRNTKLRMIEQDDTALPIFWSGFVMIGV